MASNPITKDSITMMQNGLEDMSIASNQQTYLTKHITFDPAFPDVPKFIVIMANSAAAKYGSCSISYSNLTANGVDLHMNKNTSEYVYPSANWFAFL